MKKIFSFVIVAFAALSLNAKGISFNFTVADSISSYGITVPTPKEPGSEASTNLNGTTFGKDGITVTPVKVAKTDNRIFLSTKGVLSLRSYKGSTLTFESSGEEIASISIEGTGAFEGVNNGVWAGTPAKSVTLTCAENATINRIVVYTGEAPVVTIDTLNVADIIPLIPTTPGQKLSKKACVIGRVSGLSTSGIATYGNINVWLADINNTADTIEAYAMLNYNGVKYNDVEEVQFGMGDTIVVYSSSWEYYSDDKNQQYEASKGCSLAKVVGPGHPKPIVIEEKTVAEAIEIGEGLAAGAKTTDKYDVRGYVVSISGTQGLNKLYLADDVDAFGAFVAYQSEIPEGANVVEGSFVSVVGYIEKFQFEGSTEYTIEISKGKLTVLEDPSALPNVIAEKVSCKKMMINGQMYIKNGNKLYNVLGQAL